MRSSTLWKLAERPNYNTHINKRFPYSETPYLGEYHLEKIPASLNNLVQHVDYWGEGKIVSEEGVRGFSDCYNVNHQYQLVSNGPDLDRKIPNRIPLRSDDHCDTSGYIKDNSVLTVTVAVASRITSSCAQDIARIVNSDHGKVVVYGVHGDSQEISELAVELRKKGLTPSPDATLPHELQGLTYYDSHVAFLDTQSFEEEMFNNVINGDYNAAVSKAQSYGVANDNEFVNNVVMRLITDAPRKVMTFAYKLWEGGAKNVVRNSFPKCFQHIFNEDAVTIVNKQYLQPLKLDVNTDSYNDRLAWGDNDQCEITSERLSWKILPVWHSDGLTFKLYNIHRNMYLKLDVNVDSYGDRKAWGSVNSDEERHRYYLEPLFKNGTLVFFIINYKYGQGLKLDVNTDSYGDRLLWGHNGTVHNEYERFRWIIAAW
ncbi:hypothetical protein PYW08_002208 [Mythimna loreyi]|uniref:Uncharacterized protein n=1 Tax=Mythimna loreyi TaxID=667449 RepID=A0ACC2R3S6_9NEOP|nr:hypothetical protein PYW08_002208 [Mythimna loreyi]